MSHRGFRNVALEMISRLLYLLAKAITYETTQIINGCIDMGQCIVTLTTSCVDVCLMM